MKYYCATCHSNGEIWREVVEYDESNGVREYREYTIRTVFIPWSDVRGEIWS